MVIGRGSRREHPQPTFCSTTKKKTRKKPGMRRIYFRSRPLPDRASSGDVTSDQNCTTLVRKKKRGGKAGHAQNILPVRTASGQGLFRSRDRRHFRWKGPTKVDIA